MRVAAFSIIFFIIASFCFAQESQYSAGIVFGPKAAFQITAPDGWVLDNKTGLPDTLHCVLYMKNYSWETSPILIYAKIAGTSITNVNKFIKDTIRHMKEQSAYFKCKKLGNIPIDSTHTAIIYEYRDCPYTNISRVAYIQVPNAVCFIVYSTDNKYYYKKHIPSYESTVKSFVYKPEFIEHKE